MDFKIIGGILLIVGTSIGAGMLALPIATAQLGFFGSLILLIACWAVMTAGALLLLEVNLWMPQNSNLVTMAKKTIGPFGQIISWITYLLLLYSLLCAYIAGGSDIFHDTLRDHGLQIPRWISSIILTIVLGAVVYFGIRFVDYVNRGLMVVKLGGYILLVALLMPFISAEHLAAGSIQHVTSIVAITVTITSFGYAAIVPSLRVYFNGDVKKLRIAILIGSLIPFICYIAWDAVIMGIIPLQGDHGLIAIMESKASTSQFVDTLSDTVNRNSVSFLARLFTSICMVTSFLGVALCLADFLADGLQMEKKGGANFLIHLLTFLPPLIIVLFFPNAFVTALQYAGIYCIVLLILLPAWMAWRGRYVKRIAKGYQVFGGKALLIFMMVFSLVLMVHSIV